MHISFILGTDHYMSCTRILMVRRMFPGVEGDIPKCVQHSTCHSWSHFPHILLHAIWMYIMWSWYSDYYYIVGKPLSIQTTLLDIDAVDSVLFNLLLQFFWAWSIEWQFKQGFGKICVTLKSWGIVLYVSSWTQDMFMWQSISRCLCICISHCLGHMYAFKPIYPILSLDKVLWFAMQRFRV
jgi:hypothetical protein